MTAIEIVTSHGPARAELTVPGGDGPPSFLLVLTHGAGGSVNAPDLLAVRNAAVPLGGATALVTQPYRVRGARAPGSPDRQDEAWREIIAALRRGSWSRPRKALSSGEGPPAGKVPLVAGEALPGPGLPLIVGGRSNGARVACRTATAVGASGVVALAFPLCPPGRRAAPGSAGTSDPPTREAELHAATEGGAQVLVVNGDKDPFGTPAPGDAIQVVTLKGESHSLSRHPAAVTDAVADWLRGVMPLVR